MLISSRTTARLTNPLLVNYLIIPLSAMCYVHGNCGNSFSLSSPTIGLGTTIGPHVAPLIGMIKPEIRREKTEYPIANRNRAFNSLNF